MEKLQLIYPLKKGFLTTQRFGETRNLQIYKDNNIQIVGHNGVDYGRDVPIFRGEPVYAAHDGVAYISTDNKEGCGVVIRTDKPFYYNDEVNCYYKTIYWHLLPNIPLRNGQSVSTGDLIGYADNSGLSTGDHLHFGLKPQLINEDNGIWYNVEQTNGYLGAISPDSYWSGYYPEDIKTLLKIKSIAEQIINLLKNYLTKNSK